jgi:3-oxoacyl-[acyl-carrier-protein] synthase-3
LDKFQHDYRSVLANGPHLYLSATGDDMKRTNLTLADLDLIIPHQANGRIAEIGAKLGFPKEKVFMNFERVGNTANASLLLCLDEVVRFNNTSNTQGRKL